jgi:hypothetical protein
MPRGVYDRASRIRTLRERFMAGLRPQPNGCVFFGTGRPEVYGRLHRLGGTPVHAHRVAWELYHGPIPDDMCVLHRCDTPRCVAEAHLFLGSKADNSRDMIAKGRGKGQRFPGWNRAA